MARPGKQNHPYSQSNCFFAQNIIITPLTVATLDSNIITGSFHSGLLLRRLHVHETFNIIITCNIYIKMQTTKHIETAVVWQMSITAITTTSLIHSVSDEWDATVTQSMWPLQKLHRNSIIIVPPNLSEKFSKS